MKNQLLLLESQTSPLWSDFSATNLHFIEKTATTSFLKFNAKRQATSKALKYAPLIGLGLILIIIMVIIGFILTPSLLINHFVQTVTDKFNYQATSLEARSNLLLDSKWQGGQKSPYRIVNEYQTMPDTLAKNLEHEGFSIHTENKQMTKVFYKNKPIERSEFLSTISHNININEAKNNSFNSKRVAFQDGVWQKNARNWRLSKKGFTKPTDKNAVEDFNKQELAITKVDDAQMRFNTDTPTETDEKGNVHEKQSPSINIFKSLTDNLKYINQQADQASQEQKSPFYRSFNNLKLAERNFVNNQSACGLYHNSNFLQNYAKTPQAGQQSQLAMNLFIEAEKIKAGIATPESAEFYGKRLTETYTTTKANGAVVETKSATDSFGYKYAAFGDTPQLNENAERYVLGANPTIAQSQKAISQQNQCQNEEGSFLKRLFSSFFSNIANLLNPFKLNLDFINQLLDSGKDRQITENTVAAMSNLKVAPNTVGEDLGNAIVAGSGFFLGKNAAIGGNNILTQDQAVAYLQEQDKYLAMQGKIEAKNLSPFALSSKHTMMGSMISSNLHLFTQLSSLRSVGLNILKSAKLSLARLNPVSQAKRSAVYFERCQDSEFLKLNKHLNGQKIALDPFCNPIYGVDVQAIKTSPIDVINQLVNSGDLVKTDPKCQEDCELVPAGDLKKYQKNCINRARLPIGDEDEEAGFDDGESCLANSPKKSLYALFFIDQRLNKIFNEVKPL